MKTLSIFVLFVSTLCVSSTYAQVHDRLIGNTMIYKWNINSLPSGWGTPEYVTVICDAETLVWNNVTDPDNITSGVERYETSEVSPGVLQLSWKESPETTNLGVILTINIRAYAIYGVIVNIDPLINYTVAGGINFQRGVEVDPKLRGCE